jgi:hypothetical protein
MRNDTLEQGMRIAAILLAACSTPQPAPQPGTSPSRHAEPAISAPVGSVAMAPAAPRCCQDEPPRKDQPPEIKLKLGHYRNARRGIGLVFDRSTEQAKLRFDGTSEILKLDRQHGAGDRIDFIRSLGHVVLQQWDDGRVVVFVGGDGIEVRRDGDADPL